MNGGEGGDADAGPGGPDGRVGPRGGGPAGLPAPGPAPLVVLAVALAVASAAAGRYRDTVWTGILMLSAGTAFGIAAGLALRLYWRGRVREALAGAGGLYLLFLGGVLFTAAEAYAFGVALDRGAPVAAAAFLVPPVAVAGFALRSAARRVSFPPRTEPDGAP